jgi:hypothetical protein
MYRNHIETLRSGLTLRTNVKAGYIGTRPNHNETLQTSMKARRLTRGALVLTAGLVTTVLLATSAQAQPPILLNFTCDLGGVPARLTMEVEVVKDPLPTGDVSYFYQGTLISATGRYSFQGENQFADFVDHLTNERFRVQMIVEGQHLRMIINPYGPGPTQHLCQLSGAYPQQTGRHR